MLKIIRKTENSESFLKPQEISKDLYSKILKILNDKEKYSNFLKNNPIKKELPNRVEWINSKPFISCTEEIVLRKNFLKNNFKNIIEKESLENLIEFCKTISLICSNEKKLSLLDLDALKKIQIEAAKKIITLCLKKDDLENILEVLKSFDQSPCSEIELNILIEICKLILKTDDKTKHQKLIMEICGLGDLLDLKKLEKIQEEGILSFFSKLHMETFFEIFKALNKENLLSENFFTTPNMDNSDALIWMLTSTFLRQNLVAEAYEFIKKGCQNSIDFDYSERGKCGLCYLISLLFFEPDFQKELSKDFSDENKKYFPFKLFFYWGHFLPMCKEKEDTKTKLVENLKTENDIRIVLKNLKEENFKKLEKNFKDGIELTKEFFKSDIKENEEKMSKLLKEHDKWEREIKEQRSKFLNWNCATVSKIKMYFVSPTLNPMLNYYKKQIEKCEEEKLEIHNVVKQKIEEISKKRSFKKHYFYPFILQLEKQINEICSDEGNKNKFLRELEKLKKQVKEEIEIKGMEHFNFLISQEENLNNILF